MGIFLYGKILVGQHVAPQSSRIELKREREIQFEFGSEWLVRDTLHHAHSDWELVFGIGPLIFYLSYEQSKSKIWKMREHIRNT